MYSPFNANNANNTNNAGMFGNVGSISTQPQLPKAQQQLPTVQQQSQPQQMPSFIPPQPANNIFQPQQQSQPQQSQQQLPTVQQQSFNQIIPPKLTAATPIANSAATNNIANSATNPIFSNTVNFAQPANFQIPTSANSKPTTKRTRKAPSTKGSATTKGRKINTSQSIANGVAGGVANSKPIANGATKGVVPITPTYEIAAAMATSFAAYPSETKYPYTEPLPSPYENDCPFKNLFLCAANCSTNLMYFDKTLLSIKLTEFKDEPNKIYQVSIQDLKQYYAIDDKAMTAFKTHYRVQPKAILAKYTNYKQQLEKELEKIKSYSLVNQNVMNAQNQNSLNQNQNVMNAQNQQFQNQNSLNQNQLPSALSMTQFTQPQLPKAQQTQPQTQPSSDELDSYTKYYTERIKYIQKEIDKITKTVNSAEEKNTATIIYNTSTYPITDKSGKWLTISYLIPYLMFASPIFITHTSRVLTNLLAATSYNTSIPDMTTYIQTLNAQNNTNYPTTINSYLELLGTARFTPAILGDPKFKPNSQLRSTKSAVAVNKNSEIHKIIIQTPNPIIPELYIKTPVNQQTYNQYITPDINNMFNTKQFDINKLHTFYDNIQSISKMLNPADMAAVASLLKLKTLDSQITIIKVKPADIAATDITTANNSNNKITNKELVNKLSGIKIKKVKVVNPNSNSSNNGNTIEQTLTSQPIYTYQEETINNLATLQTLYRYAISENKLPAIPEETIKSIKAKTTGDINLYQTFITLANSITTVPSQTSPDGTIIPERQALAFNIWLDNYKLQMKQAKALLNGNGSQKKIKAKNPLNGANIAFIDEDNVNENVNEDNENENENEDNENENGNYDGVEDKIEEYDDSSMLDEGEIPVVDETLY